MNSFDFDLMLKDKRGYASLSSVIGCYRPKYIYNKYLDKKIVAPCGECFLCKNKKSLELSNRVQRECHQHKYSLFFTLTYDNEYLPCYYVSLSDSLGNVTLIPSSRFNRSNQPPLVSSPLSDLSFPRKKVGNGFEFAFNNRIGVLCKNDIQKFLKRVRYYVDKQFKDLTTDAKQLRYFIVGEYGPKSLRPHYHGIIWTESSEILSALCDNLRNEIPFERRGILLKAWPFHNPENFALRLVDRQDDKAPQYISQYLTCSSSLPKVLQHKSTRPFYLCSKNPIIGCFKVDKRELFNRFFETKPFTVEVDKKTLQPTYVCFPLSVFDKFFPRPSCFSTTSIGEQLSVYYKYENLKWNEKSKFNRISEKGSLLDLSPTHQHGATDAFNYLDYRFAQMVGYWCSHTPDGYPRLTPKKYISLLHKYYDKIRYFSFCKHLLSEDAVASLPYFEDDFMFTKDFVKDFPFSKCGSLVYAKDLLLSLPRTPITRQYWTAHFAKKFAQYGLKLHHLYRNSNDFYHLRTNVVDYFLKNHSFVVSERIKYEDLEFQKILHKSHNSKLNKNIL